MPAYLANLGMQANGNINVSQFVTPDPTLDFAFVGASGNTFLLGVSQEGPREPVGVQTSLFPGTTPVQNYAAIAGEQCKVYTVGDVCGLVVGSAAVVAGDLLTNDGNGYGITAITGNNVSVRAGRNIGALALQGGNPADIINVLVVYTKS